MPLTILMPALSPTMKEGKLDKWLVKEGDIITAGTILAEIETDKAIIEMEAVDEGTIGKILINEGMEQVAVNTPIAILLEDGEKIDNVDLTKFLANNQDLSTKAQESSSSLNKIDKQTDINSKNQQDTINHSVNAKLVNAKIDKQAENWQGTFKATILRDALRDAIAEEMRRDPDVFIMGEEVAQYQGAYKVTRELLQEFGKKRVLDTPITEHGFAGLGVGAAFAGLKPIVEFMTWNFAMQAIDHIVNSAAKTRYMSGGQISCPIVFRGPNAAASRVGAQHSQDFTPWYGSVPGLIVISPYCAADAKGLLKSAIRNPNPVVFLEHELLYGEEFDVPDSDDYLVPIGKARVRKLGTDVTIIAMSQSVKFALEAADSLEQEGINAEVLDLRTVRPLDIDAIVTSVKKTGRLVTVEESWPFFGLGAEIAWQATYHAFDYLDAPPHRVTQEDVPLPYAENLEKLSLPNTEKVIKACKAVLHI